MGFHPAAVEVNEGFVRIQDLEDLAFIGVGVGLDLLLGQGRPGLALAGGIADQTGEIADEKDHLMTQVLKIFQFLDEHGVAQVKVRGGGVKAGFHAQRLAGGHRTFDFGGHFLFR